MGGKTGRPRKRPQADGLDDNIYWRAGSYRLAYRNPRTGKMTTKVILKNVPEKQQRQRHF